MYNKYYVWLFAAEVGGSSATPVAASVGSTSGSTRTLPLSPLSSTPRPLPPSPVSSNSSTMSRQRSGAALHLVHVELLCGLLALAPHPALPLLGYKIRPPLCVSGPPPSSFRHLGHLPLWISCPNPPPPPSPWNISSTQSF